MSKNYDAIVIGGGHNGLVCASYLAKSGKSVAVLEAGEKPGGMAVTEELIPGAQAPTVAHLMHHLHPKVVGDLGFSCSPPYRC